MKSGPVVIVEDDADDQDLLNDVLKELNVPNKLLWFENSMLALDYLRTTNDQPFLILCDVNLPGVNGVEFKRELDSDPYLRKKSIPFIFYSTAVDQEIINEVYTKMTVQGYFKKGNRYEEIKSSIKLIIDYWYQCKHPNSF